MKRWSVQRYRGLEALRSRLTLGLLWFGFGLLILLSILFSRQGGARGSIYLPLRANDQLASLRANPGASIKDFCLDIDVPEQSESRVCVGESFSIGGLRLRLRAQGGSPQLELVGAELELGAGAPDVAVIGASVSADRILRFPGMGGRQLELLAGGAGGCPVDAFCVRSLLGGDRTRLQRGGGAASSTEDRVRLSLAADSIPVALGLNEMEVIREDDVLWAGLMPFEVSFTGRGLIIEAPKDYQSFGGERSWLRDPTPRWPLKGSGPWTVFGESELFDLGHIKTERMERQLEEEIQELIDLELLCIEPGMPNSVQPPRIVWRSSTERGCSSTPAWNRAKGQRPSDSSDAASDSARVREGPSDSSVAASDSARVREGPADSSVALSRSAREEILRERYRYHPGLMRILTRANTALADGSYLAGPELLHFTFDWSYVLPPESASSLGKSDGAMLNWEASDQQRLLPVPERLLGIWWGTTVRKAAVLEAPSAEGLRSARQGGSPLAPIRMRAGSSSASFRVVSGRGGLRRDDLLLLTGRSSPAGVKLGIEDAEQGELVGVLCLSAVRFYSDGVFQRAEGRSATGKAAARVPFFYGSAIPLGRLNVSSEAALEDEFQLLPLPDTSVEGCLNVARDDEGAYYSSLGAEVEARGDKKGVAGSDAGGSSGRERAAGASGESASEENVAGESNDSSPPLSSFHWSPLAAGSTLSYQGLTLVFRNSGDLAALSQFDQKSYLTRRIYPFEADAGQLIGRGWRHASGLEASVKSEVLEAAGEAGIELSVHGDLQRLLARGLYSAMEVDLHGKVRDRKALTSRRGSAVLLDSDTGAILATATWPPFDPNLEPQEELELSARRRRMGYTFDFAENWAFTRDRAAGSTYKLATSLALARAGFLKTEAGPAPRYSCAHGLSLYQWVGKKVVPDYAPNPNPKQQWRHFACMGQHKVIPARQGAYGPSLVQAFSRSCNVFFGLAALSLIGDSPPFGGLATPRFDSRARDRGLGARAPQLFGTPGCGGAGSYCLGYLLPRLEPSDLRPGGFGATRSSSGNTTGRMGRGSAGRANSVSGAGGANSGLATEWASSSASSHSNRLWETLMELGHRFYYTKKSGGRVGQQREAEWAPGLAYPTAELPWLPGISPGVGFRYPEIAGPASIAGDKAWPAGRPPGPDWQSGRLDALARDKELKTIAVTGWGQEVAASALSLAVIGAVPASRDGRLISPWLIRGEREERILEPHYLWQGRELIRKAMRQVLQPAGRGEAYSGTGWSYFRGLEARRRDWLIARIGGKTGTIQRSVPATDSIRRLEQLRRVKLHACGVKEVGLNEEKEWKPLFGRVSSTMPPAGFAAHTGLCRELIPGRVPLDVSTVSPDLVKRWLEAYKGRLRHRQTRMVRSSAFIATVFDPFVERESSRALSDGRGLVLAVIADNHERAAKEAAAAILSDIAVYYQTRGDALPHGGRAP